jgi:DNA-binding CsgD family transcriptional regulator
MVQIIVGFLDAEGRVEDAVAEIGHALALAKSDPAAVAVLEGIAACLLSLMGDPERAMGSIRASERAQTQTTNPAALGISRPHCAAARLFLLMDDDLANVHDLMAMGSEKMRDNDALFLTSVYIPYRFALGERNDVHPWIRMFRIAAEAAGHEYRMSDAATFAQAEAVIERPAEVPGTEGISPWNWLGRWRVQTLRLRAALLQGDAEGAEHELKGLLAARRRAGDARLDEIDAFEANFKAKTDAGSEAAHVPIPQSVHLMNIASILAGAEAVAIAGSQADAGTWYDWLSTGLPARIQTSLEWPVSRLRVQGLLALRAGDVRGARKWLEQAIDWSVQANYPIEKALAQVQLAEFLEHNAAPSYERRIRSLRGEGWRALRAIGIDPTPHAYIVAHTRAVAREYEYQSPLTKREVEVLALLAEGLSYKEIAARLGIKWPTVQALAHRCYDKLEASGRTKAVQMGRDMGII